MVKMANLKKWFKNEKMGEGRQEKNRRGGQEGKRGEGKRGKRRGENKRGEEQKVALQPPRGRPAAPVTYSAIFTPHGSQGNFTPVIPALQILICFPTF